MSTPPGAPSVPPGAPSVPPGAPSVPPHALSPAATDVASALQSLSRAARSFSLYDAQNEAVKRLIADFRDKTVGLMRRAPLTVDIYPFELHLGEESVYKELDRERSLSFRLFRDGVRKLHFAPGVDWSEMVSLLEVLSIRCTGVRQQEDDLITLLRKADFKHIAIEAVEGYMPDEEHPEAGTQRKAAAQRPADQLPADWDLPLPAPGANAKVLPCEVDLATLAALQAEEGPDAMPEQAVRAVAEMLELARALGDAGLRDELVPFVEEVQEYLFVARRLDQVEKLADLYARAFDAGTTGERRTLPMLGDDKAFERLLRALPERGAEAPAAFFAMVEALPGDHLSHALELLSAGAEGLRRITLVGLIERAAQAHPEVLIERLPTSAPPLARELFTILGRVAPERCLDAAFALVEHPDAAFQLELVETVGRAPANVRLARGLQKLMASTHEEVRIRAAQRLMQRGGPRAVSPIAEHVRTTAATLSPTEASALGRALARASSEDALPLFEEWARPARGLRGFVSRLAKETPAHRMLAWVAVSGLELIAGAEAGALLAEVATRAHDELAVHTHEVLARRAGGSNDG